MPMNDLLTRPMREELTRAGIDELRTPEDVDQALRAPGTVLVAVNSTCGCAAALMRPALLRALAEGPEPDRVTTVFASTDREATARAREYFTGYPPSSPSVALLRDGELVFMLERSGIERRDVDDITADIQSALERHCS